MKKKKIRKDKKVCKVCGKVHKPIVLSLSDFMRMSDAQLLAAGYSIAS